jgi:tRNA A64-2'-O-ribosylphosphate transferase
MFHANRAELLAADRDDLPGLVEEFWNDDDICNRWKIGEELVGVPGPSSKLALSIGQPISSSPWNQPPKIHTIRIVVLDKPKKGKSPISRSSSTSIFTCPSPRSHPGAYTISLESLVNHVEDLLDEKASIILRPGNSGHLEAAEDSDMEDPGDVPLSPSEAIEARQTIIPLALVLLLSIPDLGGELELGKGLVDKGVIADMLHQLVALWPDGNPPRAALKRVNEYLMSKRG